tara:strand:+ start:615 stop:860 length:246 start_codon:yes stop_codon:yes gene_type:complete
LTRIGREFSEKKGIKMKTKEEKELKSPIDSKIIDLIIEHYNIQSLEGRREVLTGDQFTEIVNLAEDLYIRKMTEGQEIALA